MVSNSDIINVCFGIMTTVVGIVGVIAAWRRFGPRPAPQVDIEAGHGLLNVDQSAHGNIALEDVNLSSERLLAQGPTMDTHVSREAISTILQAVSTLLHPR